MTSCYSFFRRKQRPRSEAYTITDITFCGSASEGNRPDSMTANWLGRAPIPHTAYSSNKTYEKAAKRIGLPYDPHPKHSRSASTDQDYQCQENEHTTHESEFNSKHNEKAASRAISKVARQKQDFEQVLPSFSVAASSSSELSAPNSNRGDVERIRLRRTSSQPEYRIERSLFHPVSVSYNSFEVSSTDAELSDSAAAGRDNTKIAPLKETFSNVINEGEVAKGKSNKSNNQITQLSTEHAQSGARPKAKIRVIRMISTPLPHSSNEPQTTVSASRSQGRREIREQNDQENEGEVAHAIPLTYSENWLNQNRNQPNSALSSLDENEYENVRDGDATYRENPVFARDTRVLHDHDSGALPEQARRCIDHQRNSRAQLIGCTPPSYNSIHRGGIASASWHNYLRPRVHGARRLCDGQRTCCDDYTVSDEKRNSGRKKISRFRRQQSARYSSRSRTTAENCRAHSAQVTAITVINDERERGTAAFCYRSESSSPHPRAVALPPYSVLPQSESPPSYEQAMLY